MPFTVAYPGGTKDSEFEAYVRLLEKWGIDWANASRTPEPATHHRWLHVWDDAEQAERFAQELRQATGDQAWYVHRLSDQQVSEGALGPLDIYVGRQSDGFTYTLHPNSRRLVRKRFPHARQIDSVFIRSNSQADFESTYGPVWDHIALILTGLSEPELQELGGYRIFDPMQQKPWHEPVLSA